MFTKRYRHDFSRSYSRLIDVQFNISEKFASLFYTRGMNLSPSNYFRKSFSDMEYELRKKDSLIKRVEFMFLLDLISGNYSFNMIVTVNASFLPECVDEICQEYFNTIEKEMLDHFTDPSGRLITDDEAEECVEGLIKNWYSSTSI